MPTAASDTWNLTTDRLEPAYSPELAKASHIKISVAGTYAKGTVMGQITATGFWIPYLTGASDGSETARRILQYTVVVDASLNHSWGPSQWGSTQKSVPAFYAGYFRTAELTGLDAAGVTDMVGNLISGSVSDGVLRIG